MASTPPLIAVYGSSTIRPGDAAWQLAHDIGRELALAGAGVMTGGYCGAMEACSQGANEAGGHVVGVTVELFEHRSSVNRWVHERVHMQQLYQRLEYLVEKATGFIVLPGSIGTLNELFLTWTLVSVSGRAPAPIVLLGTHWQRFLESLHDPDLVRPELFRFVQYAATPAEAARLVLAASPRPQAHATPTSAS